MLILSNNASCDICLENYHSTLLPYSLPCGHVLCASCCVGIIDSAETSTLCPFCRNPYTRDGIRVIRIESETSYGGSLGEGSSRLGDQTGFMNNEATSANHTNETTRAFHQAKCDFCANPILGERFKCAQCPDFDSCTSCFPHVPIMHPGHIFIRIRSADDYFYEANRQPRLLHNATCDNCRQMIQGIRYKCSHPACVDFDLCENCEAQPIPVHPTSHVFYKIRSSEQPPAPTPPLPHPAACNACQSGIFGIRYKCMNCYDFDLCERCEAANLPSIHPPSHLLVKIRDPRIALR